MITEFDLLDHVMLDEETKTMLLLVIDLGELWKLDKKPGVLNFRAQRLQEEKNLEHLICLKNKVEAYVSYIRNTGLLRSFPGTPNPEQYDYEIRVLTDFDPEPDYLQTIRNMNYRLSQFTDKIKITTEKTN